MISPPPLYSWYPPVLVVCIWRHHKHDFANYDRFVSNFGMAYKTIQRVSVPNLKSFGPTKTQLQAKEVGEFSIMLYGKMGRGRSLAHQHGCHNINVWRFSKLWTAVTFAFIGASTWNLQRSFKMGLFTLLKFCSKNRWFKFLMTSLQTMNTAQKLCRVIIQVSKGLIFIMAPYRITLSHPRHFPTLKKVQGHEK